MPTRAPTQAPPALTDEELALLAKRDPEAFGLLYDRYADLVFRACWRRLGTREDAEDATQLVFAKAFATLPRFRVESFRSWLFAIAHNVLVDRHRAAHEARSLGDAELAMIDPEPTPEEAALATETRRSIRGLLAACPANERSVLELRLAELTDKEIADALGLSYGHVRVLQHRAAQRLRLLLARPGEEAAHV